MNKEVTGSLQRCPPAEVQLWEEQWIECAKQLNQWDLLCEFAAQHDLTDLLMESAWRVPDWLCMKDAIHRKGEVFRESLSMCIWSGYTQIHERLLKDIDKMYMHSGLIALGQWVALPGASVRARTPLLQKFQALVEFKESARIVKEVSSSNAVQSIGDIKFRLSQWRERLPNMWEDVTVWSEIIAWRQYVYKLVNNAFQHDTRATAIARTGHHEMAYSINRFAHVMRRHGLVELCLNSLSKIYELPNIEIHDAFLKLREQAMCYFQMPSESYKEGLQIIKSTNLEFFGEKQTAQFHHLQGEFLSRMGNVDEAAEAFSTAVASVDDDRAWLGWARFCDQQWVAHGKATFAEHALVCYSTCRVSARTPSAAPVFCRGFFGFLALKCLAWPGSTSGAEQVAQASDASVSLPERSAVVETSSPSATPQRPILAAFAAQLQSFRSVLPHCRIWLPWLPQLIQMLDKIEGAHVTEIMISVLFCWEIRACRPAAF